MSKATTTLGTAAQTLLSAVDLFIVTISRAAIASAVGTSAMQAAYALRRGQIALQAMLDGTLWAEACFAGLFLLAVVIHLASRISSLVSQKSVPTSERIRAGLWEEK